MKAVYFTLQAEADLEEIGDYIAAVAGWICLLLTLIHPLASAQTQAPAGAAARGVMTFDIPAQALDSALADLSRASGVQMLFDSSLAVGRRSTAISGRYSLEDALVRLLEGTGLRARFTPRGSIVIMAAVSPDITLDMLRVEAAPIVGRQPPDAQWLAYAQIVQRDIVATLEADTAVWRGDYRISLSFWLDPGGQITRTQILRPSGKAERDAAFSRAASKVLISSPPPTDLPQPLRIEFSVR